MSRIFPDQNLATRRLLLRPFSVDDVDLIVSAAGDELVQRWLPMPRPYTREDAVHWCTVQAPEARTSGAGLARAVTHDERLVGAIDGSRRRPASAPKVSPGRPATCTVAGSTWWSTRWSAATSTFRPDLVGSAE
jgi:RimJ/RimL family protein N-acetyltransferase